jgi:hypothetical protein
MLVALFRDEIEVRLLLRNLSRLRVHSSASRSTSKNQIRRVSSTLPAIRPGTKGCSTESTVRTVAQLFSVPTGPDHRRDAGGLIEVYH